MFDGKVPHWYHWKCFFGKQRPKTAGDIAHFESLRYEDQQKINEQIGKYSRSHITDINVIFLFFY